MKRELVTHKIGGGANVSRFTMCGWNLYTWCGFAPRTGLRVSTIWRHVTCRRCRSQTR